MREKFTMSATPTRIEYYWTQLRGTLSKAFSAFTWNRIRDFMRPKPFSQEPPRYIVQKERKTDERHVQQRIKKETARKRGRRDGRKRHAMDGRANTPQMRQE
ncbi:uncharacterized protein LOC114746478 [Neltuma alba]|uniref:uncharacterized protein LOC114746478 n=1 Tax=Neltuma alba TaxID=207710 RepID=UPI0010A592FD|nr:uncharacterized protein LOC114746478 [Prosopis alba]